jgi:3-oxoacyl-[acyl-carrier protein] reductase
MEIAEKAAIVTGSATGVGRATALKLAKAGCSVLVNYSRSQAEAEQTAQEVEALGVKTVLFKADVADDDQCRAMVDAAVGAFGRLDVLVNNAGRTNFIPLNDLDAVTDDIWHSIMNVNLLGPFHCTRAAKDPLLASGGGDVVNVSSVAALLGKGSSIPYAASKAALNNVTVALARALAPKIRVNSVAPGFIDGRWLRNGVGESYDRLKSSFERRLPLEKVCQPEDVADAIISLITGSDLVTGQSLVCDGGMMIAKWNT